METTLKMESKQPLQRIGLKMCLLITRRFINLVGLDIHPVWSNSVPKDRMALDNWVL